MRVIHTLAVLVLHRLQFRKNGREPAGCRRYETRTASPTWNAALRNRIYIGIIFVLLGFVARGVAQNTPVVTPRIVTPVDEAVRTALAGNIHPLARPEFDEGRVDPSMPMRLTLVFKMTPSQQADLDALLAAQQQRGSPDYQRWLTPEQFGSRFGRSQSDINKVTGWLESAGFRIEGMAASRNMITFSGTAQQVEAALRTEMRRYSVHGETRYGNASDPFVPAALADMALAFRGLNNFQLKPRAVRMDPRFTSSVSGAHYLTPPDFATIYDLNPLYQKNIDGTGQKIAVMGQSDIRLTDVEAFRNNSKLPPKDPQIVYVTKNPGLQKDDVIEANLDVEWSGAIAPNATVILIVGDPVSGGGIFDALNYAIAPPTGVPIPAPVISISYGFCEQEVADPSQAAFLAFLRNLAQQANVEGITIFAASGDLGAADCDSSTNTNSPPTTASPQGLGVDLPGALPNVTSVGGTQFTEGTGSFWQAASIPGQDVTPGSALSYIPEGAWNETNTIVSGNPVGLAAGGGGSSIITPKPIWQAGAGVPNDGARDVPDVSLSASFLHDDYLICTETFDSTTQTFSTTCPTSGSFRNANGGLTAIGGTSAGAPAMAGIMALINQATHHPGGSGNINPVLYPMAAQVPAAFHDVTKGTNQVPFSDPCGAKTVIGYTASPGYDLATGLGSIDAFVMVNNWTSVLPGTAGSSNSSVDFSLALSPAQMSVTKGSCGTAQLLLAPLHGFSGTPSFTCTVSSSLGSTTCSIVPVAAATSLLVPAQFNDPDRWWTPIGVIVILLAALGWTSIMFGGSRVPYSVACPGRKWTKWVPVLSLLLLCVMGLSCSGGGSGAPGGNGNNFASNANNPPPVAPSITGQPMSQSVIEGQPATFAASASGTLPLSYQWTKNGAAISGATASSYTTSATAASNQGDQFSVIVSNSAGSATSNSATLTVNVPYNFVVQVPSTTPAGSGTLTVTAQIAGISHTAQMAFTVQ